jgi:hypothetical protein
MDTCIIPLELATLTNRLNDAFSGYSTCLQTRTPNSGEWCDYLMDLEDGNRGYGTKYAAESDE